MKAVYVAFCLVVASFYAIAQHGPTSHPDATSNTSAAANTADVHNHDHDMQGPVVSYEELLKTADQLKHIREITAKYRDVRVAKADGYRNLGGAPGLGYHFARDLDPNEVDLDKPPVLMYEDDPSAPDGYALAGVMYILKSEPGSDGQPVNNPFPKSLALWHKHQHICMFKDNTTHRDNLTEEQCRQIGGRFIKETQWMLHAWVWKESPLGVFSMMNPLVTKVVPLQGRTAK